jgi:hypothetical protein
MRFEQAQRSTAALKLPAAVLLIIPLYVSGMTRTMSGI